MSTSEAKIPQPALEAWGLLKDEFPNIGLEHLFKQGVDVGKAWQEIYKLRMRPLSGNSSSTRKTPNIST